MNVNLGRLMAEANIPELASPQVAEQHAHQIVMSALSGFAEGDINIPTPLTYAAAKTQRLFGVSDYAQGQVAQELSSAARHNGVRVGSEVQKLQKVIAQSLMGASGSGRYTMPTGLPIRLDPAEVIVDGRPISLQRNVRTVVEIGACVASASMVTDQIKFAEKFGTKPFTYIPISATQFVQSSLLAAYRESINEATGPEQAIVTGQFAGKPVGAANTGSALETYARANGVRQFADVVVALANPHVTEADLRTGIQAATAFMKPGGALVLRGRSSSGRPGVSLTTMEDWARETKFNWESSAPRMAWHTQPQVGHANEHHNATNVLFKV